MNKTWRRTFQQFAVVLNRVKLPGMAGIGLFSAMKFFWKNLREADITIGATAMAFRFFFALFPALILTIILFRSIPIENLHTELFAFLGHIFPPGSFGFVEAVIGEFFEKPGVGVISLNVLLLAISATGGIKTMINAFYRNDEVMVRKKFLRLNLSALLIFFLLISLVILLFILLFAGEWGIASLERDQVIQGGFAIFLARFFHSILIVVGLTLAISVVYYFGPHIRNYWGFITPGSVFGAILMLLAMFVFRIFISYFSNLNKIYGSISAIMIIMLWFYWISLVLLIGFELNRAIARALKWKED